MFIINIFIHKKKNPNRFLTRWLCDSSSTVWNCATSTVQGRRSRRVKPRQMDGWWRGSISPTPSVPPALRRETPGSRPSGGGTHTHTTLTHRVSLVCSSRIMSLSFSSLYFWHDVTNVLISSDFISKPEKLTSTQNRRNFPFDKMSSVPYFPWRTTKQKCHQNIRQTNIMILQSAGALIYLNLV